MDSLVLKTVGSITSSARKFGEFELGIKKMGDGTGLWGFKCGNKSLQEKVTLRSKRGLLEFYYDEEGLEKISEEELSNGINIKGTNSSDSYFEVYVKALGDDTMLIKAEIGTFKNMQRKDNNSPILQIDLKLLGYHLTVEKKSLIDSFLSIGEDTGDYLPAKIQPQYEVINGSVEDLAVIAHDRSSAYLNSFNFSGSNNTIKGSVVKCISKFKGFSSLNCLKETGIDEECVNPILGLPRNSGVLRGYALHIDDSNLYFDLDQPISETGNIEDIFKSSWHTLTNTKCRGDLSVARGGITRLWARPLAEGYSFSWKGGPNYSWNEDAVNFGSEVRIDMKMAPADEIDDFIVSLSKSDKVVATSKISIQGNCSYTNPSSLRYQEVVDAVNTIRGKGATLILL